MALVVFLLAIGCKKASPPEESGYDIETTLQGNWKLVGKVNTETGIIQEFEPVDSDEYYTLTFLSDSTMTAQGVNIIVYPYGLYTVDNIHSTIEFSFYIPGIDEPGDGNEYWSYICWIHEFDINNAELMLFNNDKMYYLLFKRR
jgi:hypothetical protein